MKYPYGKRTCAFLHTIYFNIFLPMLIFFINCTPIPDDISNQNTTDNTSTAASASSAGHSGHPSSANQTVFVGDICGQNMFWDPTLNTCKPKPNAGKVGVLDAANNTTNTNATIAKPGKKKKPFHSEEEVTDPPHHETETHVNETRQIRVNSDEEDVIPVKTDPHCGLGYEWSADDMMCAKDEQ